jgi:hypothetical protein
MAVKDSNKQESDLINDYLTERFEEAWYALDEYLLPSIQSRCPERPQQPPLKYYSIGGTSGPSSQT